MAQAHYLNRSYRMKAQTRKDSASQAPLEKKTAARSPRSRPATSPGVHLGNGEDRDEMLRKSAYYLYEARNRGEGHELDDWLQAEAQLAGLRA
jgi:Protein of unknown function (DUF2934)